MKLYTNTNDLQGAGFAVGRTLTLQEWREQAIEWAEMDEHFGISEQLETMPEEELIDFINEYWGIEIKDTDILTKEEIINFLHRANL